MPLLKLQQPRLHFFDDADVDNAHLGQAFARHGAHKRRVRRIATFRKLEEPIIRIGLENDSRPAFPLPEAIRTRADGVSANLATRRLDNFPCHREGSGQILLDDGIVGLNESKLQRVPVDGLYTLDPSVIVEFRPRLAGDIDRGAGADEHLGER